jgi:hypothetical protein
MSAEPVHVEDPEVIQLGRFPAKAPDALITTMAAVIEYPADPLRTFPRVIRMSGVRSSAI